MADEYIVKVLRSDQIAVTAVSHEVAAWHAERAFKRKSSDVVVLETIRVDPVDSAEER